MSNDKPRFIEKGDPDDIPVPFPAFVTYAGLRTAKQIEHSHRHRVADAVQAPNTNDHSQSKKTCEVFMSEDKEKTKASIADFFGEGPQPWADIGPADRHLEGTYRRGYHQAIAQVRNLLKSGEVLTTESLSEWVEGDGDKWRHGTSKDRQILAPSLIKST